MCNPPIITPSSSFESISSYSPSSSFNDKRYHMRRGMSSKSMSNSFGKGNHFLDFCSLCKTKLYLGDDIYMYRGDTPFCSEECRQDQIEIDERNEKMKSKMSMKRVATSIKIDDVQVRSVAATVFA